MTNPLTRAAGSDPISHPSIAARIVPQLQIGLMAFLTVVDLFAAQALLPVLTKHYAVSPSAMGLAVNACTLGMAAGGLTVALFSQHIDRRLGILISLTVLAIPTTLLAFAPNLWVFAGLRIAQGVCMAAAFGLMLAHIGEQMSQQDAVAAFAAYITGNVVSNLIGRLIATTVFDHSGLAANFFVFAGLNLAGALLAFLTVHSAPRAQNENPMSTAARDTAVRSWTVHFSDRRLRAGFGIGFCILFVFIGTFTFVNFVLVRPPLSVGMMQLGFIYFVFLPSIFTTPFAGRLVQRVGTRIALLISLAIALAGLPMLVSPTLSWVLGGMALVAVGAFAAQAVATSYVSRLAETDRAAASGIYLACYFSGGLVGSAVLGSLFDRFGWPATVLGVAAALGVAMALTTLLTEPTNRLAPARDTP